MNGGREDRSRKPSTPSARNHLTRMATVLAVVLNWRTAAALLNLPSTTLRTMTSRPLGLRDAFFCTGSRAR